MCIICTRCFPLTTTYGIYILNAFGCHAVPGGVRLGVSGANKFSAVHVYCCIATDFDLCFPFDVVLGSLILCL